MAKLRGLKEEGPSVRSYLGNDPQLWRANEEIQRLPADGPEAFVTYFGGTKTVTPITVAEGTDGSFYVAGNVTWQITGSSVDVDIFVSILDPHGDPLYRVYIGGDGTDEVSGIAVDGAGRIYLTGHTGSLDFPSLSGYQPEPAGSGDAFVCRLTPAGGFDYCTYLGGTGSDRAWAVATDAAGSAYVTGSTSSEDFPVTPGAFQKTTQPADVLRRPSDAFVAKLSPDGQALVYSTFLGGKAVNCIGGSRCVPAASYESGRAIAVDAQGNAYVGGTTNSSDFPVTAGAYQTECACDYFSSDLFVTKLNPAGDGLVYSTYLGGRAPQQRMPEEYFGAMALDDAGSVYIAGATGSLGGGAQMYPTTPGAYQPEVAFDDTGNRVPVPVVSKLDPGGAALVYSTFLSGTDTGSVTGIAVDPDGTAHVTGTTQATDFPLTEGAFNRGGDFHSRLSPDGSTLIYSTLLPTGFGGVGVMRHSSDRVCLLGAASYLSCAPSGAAQLPPLLGMMNAAGTAVTGKVTQGELLTFFGLDIGPDDPAGLQIGPDGKVTTELNGTSVVFDGNPLPLTYAQSDQINAVASAPVLSGAPLAEIYRHGERIARLRLVQVPAQPGVFRRFQANGIPLAAAVNQDGTVHGEDNPAPSNSVVAIYATGLGRMRPALDDGVIFTENLPQPSLPVRVVDDLGAEREILYAGQAPGMVSGVMQINFRVTPRLPLDGPRDLLFYLEVDGVRSEPFALRTQ